MPGPYHGRRGTHGERVPVRIGFRTVVVENGLLKVNGSPILLRGVNRHEFDTDHGRTVSEKLMRRDVTMMKAHNLNAVRTSHYPPHPHFLDPVSYTHLRAHETVLDLVCRLLLEKKKKTKTHNTHTTHTQHTHNTHTTREQNPRIKQQ